MHANFLLVCYNEKHTMNINYEPTCIYYINKMKLNNFMSIIIIVNDHLCLDELQCHLW